MKLILLGHSLNIQRIVDAALRDGYDVLGVVDSHYYGNCSTLNNLPILGSEKNISEVLNQYPDAKFFISCVWTAQSNQSDRVVNEKRLQMIYTVENFNLPLINLIHPTAIIPSTTRLGTGIFIDAFTVLQNNVSIDNYSMIKEQVCIAHDSNIESNCFISTQSYIGSSITVKTGCYIGIKSCIVSANNCERLYIGKNSITHPGTIILRSIPDESVAEIGSGRIRGVFGRTKVS